MLHTYATVYRPLSGDDRIPSEREIDKSSYLRLHLWEKSKGLWIGTSWKHFPESYFDIRIRCLLASVVSYTIREWIYRPIQLINIYLPAPNVALSPQPVLNGGRHDWYSQPIIGLATGRQYKVNDTCTNNRAWCPLFPNFPFPVIKDITSPTPPQKYKQPSFVKKHCWTISSGLQ